MSFLKLEKHKVNFLEPVYGFSTQIAYSPQDD